MSNERQAYVTEAVVASRVVDTTIDKVDLLDEFDYLAVARFQRYVSRKETLSEGQDGNIYLPRFEATFQAARAIQLNWSTDPFGISTDIVYAELRIAKVRDASGATTSQSEWVASIQPADHIVIDQSVYSDLLFDTFDDETGDFREATQSDGLSNGRNGVYVKTAGTYQVSAGIQLNI